jgi:hypothetical protein
MAKAELTKEMRTPWRMVVARGLLGKRKSTAVLSMTTVRRLYSCGRVFSCTKSVC